MIAEDVSLHLYTYKAKVFEVIDGDSLRLNIDKGFTDWRFCTKEPGGREKLKYPLGVYRLFGINAPEKKEREAWQAAKDRVQGLVDQGHGFIVKTHPDAGQGGFGRWLVTLFVLVDGAPTMIRPEKPSGELGAPHYQETRHWLNVNELLLREGLAVPYTRKK